ncbi:MAG TPA: class I SAM-dependent methyltransferase [Pseudobacteroides sp.]|uniref:tRNA (mnm(5)s(2)U34)-methyltransferase n=1 Tax=Pseudobacteroides sp. TaxID=1968840 RepID=UPI002F920E7A
MQLIKNCLGQSHDIAERIVKEGDKVVDATAGNGNDTVFLAKLIGETGKVYAFDIQEKALEKTKEKLKSQSLEHRVELIKDGHENMGKYVNGQVSLAMFNLGYLPGGNHSICTRFQTTKKAIEAAMELLKKNGLVILVVYYGGDSGFEEKDALMDYITTIDSRNYSVLRSEFVNQPNCPPLLVLIEKLM